MSFQAVPALNGTYTHRAIGFPKIMGPILGFPATRSGYFGVYPPFGTPTSGRASG